MLVPPEDRSALENLLRVVLALVPGVGGGALVVWDGLRDATAGRMRLTADEVTEAVGLERLTQRLSESTEFAALCVNTLEAASRTGYEAKRRRLARALIDAALNVERVDHGVLIQQALRELEPVHIRAAERLRLVEDTAQMTSDYAARFPGQDMSTPGSLRDKRSEDVIQASRQEPDPVLATLIRTGMAGAPAMFSVQYLAVSFITAFGREVIDDLRSVMESWPPAWAG